jgi:hypothetical protein
MSQPLLDTVEPDELEPPRNAPVQPTVSSQSSPQNRMATNSSDAESGMYALLLVVRTTALTPFSTGIAGIFRQVISFITCTLAPRIDLQALSLPTP